MIKCVAIDDEPITLSIIPEYCKRFGDIELQCFTSPIEGMACVKSTYPDIVFLDIEMNSHNGVELAKDMSEDTCIIETGKTKDSKYKKLCRNKSFVEDYIGVVDLMFSVEKTEDLKAYSYLHYEKLKYRSESSVRIDNGRVERLIFTEHEDGIEVRLIEIDSTHYGNKR